MTHKTALLLIDIQNDYFKNGASELVNPEKACENARLVLDYFRKECLPVVHVEHFSIRPGATFFIPGTKGAEIHSSLAPIEGEKRIIKHFPNSFRDTNLLEYLTKLGIKKLVVCGMMTHMCVDATVRAAKDHGFEVVLIGDACATKDLFIKGNTVSAHEVHNSFLAALNYFYADVKMVSEFFDYTGN